MRRLILLVVTSVLILCSSDIYAKDKLFFVFLNTNPDKEKLSEKEVNELQKMHLENIGRLNKEGVIIAAGPFDGGGGLFIMNGNNINEINEHLNTDPAIAANRFIIEVFPMDIYNGSICGAPDNYEMATYQFVRLRTNSPSYQELGKAIGENRMYMQKLQYDTKELIIHAKFNDQNDGFLILDVADTNAAKAIMDSHPSVKNGNIKYEAVPLWIAGGTFCED